MKSFDLTPGVIDTVHGKLKYLQYINCRYLFTTPWMNLPNLLEDNIIYAFHNDVNGKLYIGKTISFFDRMIVSNLSHRSCYIDHCKNGSNKYLYNALNKYKSRNFTIYILEELDNPDKLNQVESQYIKLYRTYIYDEFSNGYNMTLGGEDCSNLHLSGVLTKSRLTRSNLYGDNGAGAMNTPQAINRRLQTNIQRYGSMTGRLNETEVQLRSANTRTKLYGNPAGAMHNDSVQLQANITKLFNSIQYYFSKLINNNLPINPLNYVKVILSQVSSLNHIDTVISYKNSNPEITSDSRWTKDMSYVFDWLEDPVNMDYVHKLRLLNSKYSITLKVIDERVKLLKLHGLELTPVSYYKICRLAGLNHNSVLSHLESITNGFYESPGIQEMFNWNPEYTNVFQWFDSEDNWNSLNLLKIYNKESLLTNRDYLTSTTIP